MRFPTGRILIFAKAPIPGQVKTRLIPELGVEAATRLHVDMVLVTVRTVSSAALAPLELWCTPDGRDPMFQGLQREFDLALCTQDGSDLGVRMALAVSTALREASFAIVLGTDWPLLDPVTLAEACAALIDNQDAVLVPAEDGGYVLLGMRRFDHRVFEGVVWGTSDVANQTRDRFTSLNWCWREWPPAWDLDRPEDVRRAQLMGLFSWLEG